MTGHLTHEPAIITRAPQHYVFVRGEVTMQELAGFAHRMGDVMSWVLAHGAEPLGAPLLRYRVIDMERVLVVEAGVPVAAALPVDGDIQAGVLPGGRFVEVAEVGHPDAMIGVITELLAWADARGLVWDREPTAAGERWGCRLEIYPTDPAKEPDMDRWTTQLAFKLAD